MCIRDRWSVLRTNVAKIDRLKGEETECASDVNEVFGGRSRGFRADWLVPTKPLFPPSVHDEVMGYHVANGLDDDLEGGATGENGLGLEDDVRALHADEKVELLLDDLAPALVEAAVARVLLDLLCLVANSLRMQPALALMDGEPRLRP